jgi:hypothetical protein
VAAELDRSTGDLEGIVCPFHLAAVNLENAVWPNAPDPIKPNQRNSLTLLAKHVSFHAGIDGAKSVAVSLIALLGVGGVKGKLRNLFTWSYNPNELASAEINKHPQNSGIAQSNDTGFSEEHLRRLLDEFGGMYTPASGGEPEPGVSSQELDNYLDIIASESGFSERKQGFNRKLANAELPAANRAWGTNSEDGVRYLSEAALRSLYQHHRYPVREVRPES